MAYSVKHVANCFLQKDFSDGVATITPMKMQKLVYLTHGWHLAILGEPAIDGCFEAWPYGPVEEDLYHIFKGYGGNVISNYAKSWSGSEEKALVVSKKEKEFQDIFEKVVNKYMHFTALELSALTHQLGTPWSITRELGQSVIEDSLIKEHFVSLVN